MTKFIKHNPSVSELKELFNEKLVSNQEVSYPNVDDYFLNKLKNNIKNIVADKLKINLNLNEIQFASVPEGFNFDISIQFRELMQDMKNYMSSQQKDIIDILKEDSSLSFDDVKGKGPFINVKLNTSYIFKTILNQVLTLREEYGKSSKYKNKNIAIDYSSPNIGKSLHVGHIGTTFLGQIMTNIYKSFGFNTIGINHLGDWGTPVGLVKIAEEEYSEKDEFKEKRSDFGDYYSSLYAQISIDQKENPELRQRAKDFFLKLENEDEEAVKFWKRLCDESIEELQKTYLSFNIVFDCFIGESFYIEYLEEAINDVKKLKVSKVDDKALLVDFEDGKFDKVLIKKSDGSTTYITRDIAALKVRKDIFKLDKTVYLVGTEQNLHFRQLFKLGDLIGYMPSSACVHIPIGLLTKNGKKISSRNGEALGFKDLYQEVVSKCRSKTEESLTDVSEAKLIDTTKKIAQASMFYSIASITPGKNSEFDIDKITNTKGKSGPSIQYASVRANSILEKVGKANLKDLENITESSFQKLSDFQSLILKIANFPVIIENCIQQDTAHLLAVYLDELVQEFSSFIHSIKIKDAEKEVKELALLLVEASKVTIDNGLRLLNVEVPEFM